MESSGYIEVKQRAGCLSYQEDPTGSRSLLAKVLMQASNLPWTPQPNAIGSFSSEPTVKYFTDYFLTPKKTTTEYGLQEQSLRQAITVAMYDCVTKDKMAVVPIWIVFIKVRCVLLFSIQGDSGGKANILGGDKYGLFQV